MDGVALGDQRLNARAARLLRQRWTRPGHSFDCRFDSPAEAKGAYHLLENPRGAIHLASLLAPHQQQTARRMAAEAVGLLAQDTTALSYNPLRQTTGLGPIGEAGRRGLFRHSLQACRLDGIPLGTAWAEVWARPPESDTARRNEQSVDEQESGRWLRAFPAGSERARQMPQPQGGVCGDREADIYELDDQIQAAPKNVHVRVRGQPDRCLSDGARLLATLAGRPVDGELAVAVPRRAGRPARTATLELRWQAVELKPRPPEPARREPT